MQIGKDDDKKESKYQKYILLSFKWVPILWRIKTPIQNYFEKVLYRIDRIENFILSRVYSVTLQT
jgi:hypothetical protein